MEIEFGKYFFISPVASPVYIRNCIVKMFCEKKKFLRKVLYKGKNFFKKKNNQNQKCKSYIIKHEVTKE